MTTEKPNLGTLAFASIIFMAGAGWLWYETNWRVLIALILIHFSIVLARKVGE